MPNTHEYSKNSVIVVNSQCWNTRLNGRTGIVRHVLPERFACRYAVQLSGIKFIVHLMAEELRMATEAEEIAYKLNN